MPRRLLEIKHLLVVLVSIAVVGAALGGRALLPRQAHPAIDTTTVLHAATITGSGSSTAKKNHSAGGPNSPATGGTTDALGGPASGGSSSPPASDAPGQDPQATDETVVISESSSRNPGRGQGRGPGPNPNPGPPDPQPGQPGTSRQSFTISGDLTELLYPGVARTLELELHNPNAFPIQVTDLDATATGIPGCPGANIAFTSWGEHPTVPARGTATTTLTVTLSGSSTDACKNVTFGFTYTGTAVQA